MSNFEEIQGTPNFRTLVEGLVQRSSLFPVKKIGEDGSLSIIDAIEKNEVTLYVPENASHRMIDAVDCLVHIYDELRRDEPDMDFVSSTVGQLKEYL